MRTEETLLWTPTRHQKVSENPRERCKELRRGGNGWRENGLTKVGVTGAMGAGGWANGGEEPGRLGDWMPQNQVNGTGGGCVPSFSSERGKLVYLLSQTRKAMVWLRGGDVG